MRAACGAHTEGSLLRSSIDGTGGSTIPVSSRSGSGAAAAPADRVRAIEGVN